MAMAILNEAFENIDGDPLFVPAKYSTDGVFSVLQDGHCLLTAKDVGDIVLRPNSLSLYKQPITYEIQYDDFRATYREKAQEKSELLRDVFLQYTPLPESIIDVILIKQVLCIDLPDLVMTDELNVIVFGVNRNIIRYSEGVHGYRYWF